ncbi:MAG TPA: class I SAM-dependent methyltransferase [Tepidisphaeraceae bacterium]|nr:class I SAM-dependent methyltransferase [Tepidisphaeraceae bacterium]
MAAPPIRDYLAAFYADQGGVEFELLEGAEYSLAECHGCGLIFQRWIGDDFLMEKLYEHWIDPQKVYRAYHAGQSQEHFTRLAQDLLELVGYFGHLDGARAPTNRLKFLDFGMGWGEWCRMALAFGCETYGAELSRARIDHAQRLGVKIVSWEEIAEHRFRFINTEQVFEHIPQPLAMLRHLVGGLAPDGLIRLSVPDGRDIKRRLRSPDWTAGKYTANSLNAVAPLEHVNCYTHDSLCKMAALAGLVPVEIPLSVQYQSLVDWKPPAKMLKNLIRPLWNKYLRKQTSILFGHA